MGSYRKHWLALIAVLIVTFSLLGYYGREVYRQAPPIPDRVATASGEVLFTQESILDGQTAWQSVGGMQLGSIWGHGAYQAPDWTADWLHRELTAWLEVAAEREQGKPFAQLDAAAQAVQKKNPAICARRSALGRVFSFMAKCSRLFCSAGASLNSSS